MKNNNKEIFELDDRYCPICGIFIKRDSPLHHCLDKNIEKIKIDEIEELDEIEEKRTFADKLDEFENFYNSDNYYDKDIGED